MITPLSPKTPYSTYVNRANLSNLPKSIESLNSNYKPFFKEVKASNPVIKMENVLELVKKNFGKIAK